jgi:hypothetical protein
LKTSIKIRDQTSDNTRLLLMVSFLIRYVFIKIILTTIRVNNWQKKKFFSDKSFVRKKYIKSIIALNQNIIKVEFILSTNGMALRSKSTNFDNFIVKVELFIQL